MVPKIKINQFSRLTRISKLYAVNSKSEVTRKHDMGNQCTSTVF